MKKRLGTVLLLALFVISSMMPTSAATAEIWNEARASHYFDAYMLGISAKGGGEMAVSFGVFGTDTMDKIGVYSLRIESEIAPNKWIEEFTVFLDSRLCHCHWRSLRGSAEQYCLRAAGQGSIRVPLPPD